jgi:hypothetical protein
MDTLSPVVMIASVVGSVIGVVELLIKPQLEVIRAEVRILNYRLRRIERELDIDNGDPDD